MEEKENTPVSPVARKRVNYKAIALMSFLCLVTIGMVVVVVNSISDAQEQVVPSTSIADPSPTACGLEESKPVLIITLNGQGAGAICTKVIQYSNGRYFGYYGPPPFDYSVVCSVIVKKTLQYTVWDEVPPGADAKQRYSYVTVCPLLKSHHRLDSQGF